MEAIRQLAVKRALEVLEPLAGGIAAGPLLDQVERMVSRTLADTERGACLALMQSRGWVTTSRHAFTGDLLYAITEKGRMAMIAL